MVNHISPPATALRLARLQLLEQGEVPEGSIDERVARSWRRSLAAGLAPTGRLQEVEHLSGPDLQRALAINHDLVSHARPVMEYLFSQVRHSHSMVILGDRRGVLMHTLGDADFLHKADRVALASGASWHEQQRGTNAIGTALAEGCGVEIHGSEHYLERNGFLTCAATPIISAKGELMGILDISGDQRSRHPHTLGLVNTAARMIENRLVIATSRHQLRLHLHPLPEGIGTVAEGIVVLSETGCICGSNRQGLALLGLGSNDLGGTALQHVLELRLEELLHQARQRPHQALRLRRRDGQVLYGLVQAERQPATTLRAVPGPATTATDALARLDTGDERWRAAADKARRVLGKPIPLLLQGESGVGKELFARAVHDASPRRNKPFVAINCAALPETLIEAELFGYSPGAFTGARKDGSIGRLREADGGTLFLDEIGDMPQAMQTRLLRVLQERQVVALGGGLPVPVDFALISATHHNLREDAETGRFRSDLYYRLNGLALHLPALRERTDFAALTDKLLRDLSDDSALHVAPELLAPLARHRWPGNLRQYANMLRTAIAMLDPGQNRIDWPHLPDDIAEELQCGGSKPPPAPTASHNLADLSRLAIQQALESAYGNLSAAARQLGISRQTLYRKLKGSPINRGERAGGTETD